MTTQAATLDQLDAQHAAELAFYDSLDPMQVIYTESGWTVKDIFQHVADWDAQIVRALRELAAGGLYLDPALDDYDTVNAQWHATHKDDTPAQVRETFHNTRAELRAALAALSDEQAHQASRAPWQTQNPMNALDMVLDMLGHAAAHMQDIRG